jgi:hypothetical protein
LEKKAIYSSFYSIERTRSRKITEIRTDVQTADAQRENKKNVYARKD